MEKKECSHTIQNYGDGKTYNKCMECGAKVYGTKDNKKPEPNKPIKENKKRQRDLKNILVNLDEWEFRLLEMNISMANSARNTIKEFNLKPDYFCSKIDISSKDYKKYISGAYEYALKDMSKLEALYSELAQERAVKQIEKDIEKKFVSVIKSKKK